MVTDPIADLLTRIRNASLTSKNDVVVPYSKQNEEVLKVLTREKYVLGFDISGEGIDKILIVHLDPNKKTAYTFKRISKPGQRMYIKAKNIKAVYNGLGISVLSTPKGLLTNKEARKQNLGGELLLEVW